MFIDAPVMDRHVSSVPHLFAVNTLPVNMSTSSSGSPPLWMLSGIYSEVQWLGLGTVVCKEPSLLSKGGHVCVSFLIYKPLILQKCVDIPPFKDILSESQGTGSPAPPCI